MTTDDRVSHQLAIHLSDHDMKRLDDLTESIPIASRNAIARAALRIGIAALQKDPAKLFATPKKARAKRR
jgi:hypothetical protein